MKRHDLRVKHPKLDSNPDLSMNYFLSFFGKRWCKQRIQNIQAILTAEEHSELNRGECTVQPSRVCFPIWNAPSSGLFPLCHCTFISLSVFHHPSRSRQVLPRASNTRFNYCRGWARLTGRPTPLHLIWIRECDERKKSRYKTKSNTENNFS